MATIGPGPWRLSSSWTTTPMTVLTNGLTMVIAGNPSSGPQGSDSHRRSGLATRGGGRCRTTVHLVTATAGGCPSARPGGDPEPGEYEAEQQAPQQLSAPHDPADRAAPVRLSLAALAFTPPASSTAAPVIFRNCHAERA